MAFRTRNLSAVVRALTHYGDRTNGQAGDVMERSLERAYGRQQQLCPVDKGNMKRLTRHQLSEDRRLYEMGWLFEDFRAEGLDGYFVFQEFGTSKMAAQPSLLPAIFEEEPRLLSDLRRVYQ